ncbi:DUF2625 family protein [Nocardia sp. NPDC058497]|uniref:DUF2625 family protein n=1 Tax=Nocardia sp. NPDC058497 TaxID=3346529 RepID=UPI00365EB77A
MCRHAPLRFTVCPTGAGHSLGALVEGSGIVSSIRSFQELAYVDDPAWPGLRDLLNSSSVPTTVLPPSADQARNTLFRLQVTARSMLGALALNTGGLLVDHGWLRVLGGGCDGLPDLASVNRLGEPGQQAQPPSALVVAIDVLGGRFAVNGGTLPAEPGEVCYFGSDTLEWSAIGGGHSAFVQWALGGGMAEFYDALRWPGWEEEVVALTPGQGLSVYPPLWSAEGRGDVAGTSRRSATLTELVAVHIDSAAQLGLTPGGESG